MPDVSLLEQLLPGALGIALMSFTETIAAGRAFARPGEPSIDANRELVASGAANLGGALLGAMPAGGGTPQTAVVRAAGGQSQKASLVTSGVAVATMLLLAPLLGLLPNATLAAVVIVYSVGLIQPGEFHAIRKVRAMEFRWALVACVGVLVFGTLKGIVVAIIVSMIGLASQTAHPRVYVIGRKRGADVLRPLSPEHPDDETFEGLLIVRPEGRLFFVNAQNVAERLAALRVQHEKPRVIALDMSRVPDIEDPALQDTHGGRETRDRKRRRLLAGGAQPGSPRDGSPRRAVRTTRPRAHAVQCAPRDRALPGHAGCRRGGPPSPLDDVPLRHQRGAHAVAQVALQFDAAVDHRAARAARALQFLTELLQELVVLWQTVDHRHRLAAAAFLFGSAAWRRCAPESDRWLLCRLLH